MITAESGGTPHAGGPRAIKSDLLRGVFVCTGAWHHSGP